MHVHPSALTDTPDASAKRRRCNTGAQAQRRGRLTVTRAARCCRDTVTQMARTRRVGGASTSLQRPPSVASPSRPPRTPCFSSSSSAVSPANRGGLTALNPSIRSTPCRRPHRTQSRAEGGVHRGRMLNDDCLHRHCVRRHRRTLWSGNVAAGASRTGGRSENAGYRRRHSGGGKGLSRPPVHRHRRRRRGRGGGAVLHARLALDRGVRAWRGAVGPCRICRDAHLRPRKRPHGRGGAHLASGRPHPRLSLRRDHRDAGRGPGPALHRADLLVSGRPGGQRSRRRGNHQGADRAGIRRVAHLDLRASGRRYLYQGCGRRRRSGRQG